MPTERPGRVLAVVSIAVFMASLDLFIVNIAMPDLAREFDGASLADLSWVLNAYAIVFAALLIPAGRIADRVGRRRAFAAGVAVFTAASLLCGIAPSVATLVAARVLQAIGAAFLMPTSLALLLPAYPPERRPVAIGIWAAVGGVAAAAGPPLGGLLVEASWRLVFLVNLPVGLFAIVAATRVLRESRDEGAERPDLLGGVLLAGAIGVLALALVQAPDWGWGAPATIACLIGAAVGVAAFVARCATHPAPVVELPMLRVRSFAAANLAALLFFTAFAAMLLGNVLFMTELWGWSTLRSGLALAPGPLAAAVTAVPAGRLVARIGQRPVALAGGLLFAAGSAWAAWRAELQPAYAADLLPGLIVGGAGVGLTLASLSSAAAAALPPARFATGSAVFSTARQLGSVLGVALLVAILGSDTALDAFRAGWWFQVGVAIAAAGAAWGIGRIGAAPAVESAPAPAVAS